VWAGNFGDTDLNLWTIGQNNCHQDVLGCECSQASRPSFPGMFPLQAVVVSCTNPSQGFLP
jgi:hypothetical protein